MGWSGLLFARWAVPKWTQKGINVPRQGEGCARKGMRSDGRHPDAGLGGLDWGCDGPARDIPSF